MRTKTIVLALALCFVAVPASFASNPNIGTWKLNESKSKITPKATKNITVVYEAASDNVKVTVDGTDGSGNPLHNEWTGKFDGKDYPLTGDPSADTQSYKKIDDHTAVLTNKKGGKVIATGSNRGVSRRQKPHRHSDRNRSKMERRSTTLRCTTNSSG